MFETSQFRSLLIIDVTLIAGLLVLLTLFPVRAEILGCDWTMQFRHIFQKAFVVLSSVAFFALAGSAFISYIIIMGSMTKRSRKYFQKAFEEPSRIQKISFGMKIAFSSPYGLTFVGLGLLFFVAYYLLAANLVIPEHGACMNSVQEKLQLGDMIEVKS